MFDDSESRYEGLEIENQLAVAVKWGQIYGFEENKVVEWLIAADNLRLTNKPLKLRMIVMLCSSSVEPYETDIRIN